MKRSPLKRGKPLRKVSPQKARRKATEKAQGAWAFMAAVKALPCCVCGAAPPSDAHHVTADKKPRSDWRCVPLCWSCHRGPKGYHAAKRTWVEANGPDYGFLDAVYRRTGMKPPE